MWASYPCGVCSPSSLLLQGKLPQPDAAVQEDLLGESAIPDKFIMHKSIGVEERHKHDLLHSEFPAHSLCMVSVILSTPL